MNQESQLYVIAGIYLPRKAADSLQIVNVFLHRASFARHEDLGPRILQVYL